MQKRLLTAAVLIAIFVCIFLFSPDWLLCIIATLVVLGASWEFFALAEPQQGPSDRITCLVLAALFPAAALWGDKEAIFGLLFVSLLFVSFRSIFEAGELAPRFEKVHLRLFGILYVGFTLSHFMLFPKLPHGTAWIFTILAAVYVGDGAAYFVGSNLGKNKMAVQLSPKKTWEGAAGSLLASVIAVLVSKVIVLTHLSVLEAILAGVCLSVSGQVGDLVESLVKRTYGVKDSGNILPGHGGFLDRVDSILFAFPLGYYLAVLFQSS